jgi:glycine dehydrogenase
VTVDDVAKRLIDYGFHAPTMSFPVAGTLMVEPTESESLAELDRLCEALIAIAEEANSLVDDAAPGAADPTSPTAWTRSDNPLRGAPHTAASVIAETWNHPYSRTTAVYPAGVDPDKYWPPVRRIDGAYGDRHLAVRLPDPPA